MTPDPIAPDALREAVLALVASFHGPQDAVELTDAVLAVVGKHRDAEVERLRGEIETLAQEWERDAPHRVVGAAVAADLRAILTDPSTTDARPDGESK